MPVTARAVSLAREDAPVKHRRRVADCPFVKVMLMFVPDSLARHLRARRWPALAIAVVTLLTAAPAFAQSEAALKSYFEGRTVSPRIDMPGTADGVDVQFDGQRSRDLQEYRDRLKRFGVAIHAGDPVVVTMVKVKKDLIEFQLGGGGYGTFGDDTSTTVDMPLMQPSAREKELERRVHDEHDDGRRRELRRELETLRDRRDRENRRITAEKATAEEVKRERVAERRLQGGSRFNLRFSGNVPASLRPEEVATALAEYVSFEAASPRATAGAQPAAPQTAPATGAAPRKGMTRAEADRSLGRLVSANTHKEGAVSVFTAVYDAGDSTVTADFVEDVLVRYSVASK